MVRASRDRLLVTADALGGAVARIAHGRTGIELHQHRIIDIRPERLFNRFQIGPVAVGG